MKILLVRLRQIGDVVFTTPAIRALREQFPDARLTYIVEPAAAPVVRGNPALDRVLVAPSTRGWRGLQSDLILGWRLRRERYDLAIDFHGGPRASLLTWLSGAPVRIGYAVVGRGWMYTRAVDRPRELRARHSVENQWDLLGPLGIPTPSRERYPVEMPIESAAESEIVRRLTSEGVRADDRLIIMHVSAGNPFRRWPMSSFGEVAASLVGHAENRRVILTSGPSETSAAEHARDDARARLTQEAARRVSAWGDDFSLAQVRALVERAALYIGGDSGPMHIAATSHVPMVSLYGPTLPARSAPWRSAQWGSVAVEVDGLDCRPCDQRVCIPGDFRCLTWITPADVIAAAEDLLGRNG